MALMAARRKHREGVYRKAAKKTAASAPEDFTAAMPEFKVQSVLITGSNRGIGLEFVQQFLKCQNPPEKIFATCRDPESPGSQELKNLSSKNPSVKVIQLDTINPASVNAAVKEVEKHLPGERLDLLINNAGVLTNNHLESQTPEDMLRTYTINVVGPMLVTQAFYPFLKRAEGTGKSAVVHISALLGSLEDVPHIFSLYPAISYRCSKAALNMLSRCHAEGYKHNGIIIIAIHPGWVKTDMGGDQAPLTKEESVGSMMKIITTLSEKHNGTFVDWEGKTIPW
ncbi:C-signal-like isoform X2 [Phyllobates terribilis]|uniref:C-signal-like isoform X2 n=1 Tax=Phyllobates terribilis TaxID=111132 RepID=UPI003CCAECC9